MADTGAAAAQTYRERLRAKAERLGGGEDARNVDASDFTPAEKLYAGVKTGMRPVSRQARADGGTVSGGHAAATPGRAGRKSGGGVGSAYINRDSKAADEDREGHYPNGGMRKGGRAGRAEGGYISQASGPSETRALKRKTASSDLDETERPAAEDGRSGRASGGRARRADGGPLATPLAAGMGGQGRMNFNFAPGRSTALKDGGRAKAHERYGHGPSCTCSSCRNGKAGGGGLGAFGGLIPMAIGAMSGDGDDDDKKPAYAPGAPKKAGGRAGRANGGAAPGPDENDPTPGAAVSQGGRYNRDAVQSAINRDRRIKGKEARMIHAVLKGRQKEDYAEGGSVKSYSNTRGPDGKPIEIKTPKGSASPSGGASYSNTRGPDGKPIKIRADGGKVAEGAIRQHKLEHKALGKAKGGSTYGTSTPLRLVSKHGEGARTAKVYKDPDWGEYRVRHYQDGVHLPKADAHTDDRDDAVATANQWTQGESKATGGRAGRKHGGKSGKTNINIIIGAGAHHPQGPGDPSQNPALAIKPPPAAPMPMPMPPGGAPPPGAAAPMPMPVPMPMPGGGGPPGMPPRARGGRAPHAGAGSGLGRLEKIRDYGSPPPKGGE